MNVGLGLMMTRALEAAGAEKIFILGRRENVLQEVAKGSVCVYECFGSYEKKTSEKLSVKY